MWKQRAESQFPGSLKVTGDMATEGGRGLVTEERFPFQAGNNAKCWKDFQQTGTETDLYFSKLTLDAV